MPMRTPSATFSTLPKLIRGDQSSDRTQSSDSRLVEVSKPFVNHADAVNILWRTDLVAEGCRRVCNKEDQPSHAPFIRRDRPVDLFRDGVRDMRLGIV